MELSCRILHDHRRRLVRLQAMVAEGVGPGVSGPGTPVFGNFRKCLVAQHRMQNAAGHGKVSVGLDVLGVDWGGR